MSKEYIYTFLAIIVSAIIVSGCSNTKSNLSTDSDFLLNYRVSIQKIDTPIDFQFSSRLPDSVLVFDENYEQKTGVLYDIDYALALKLMIEDYLDKQFIEIDTSSSTELSIELISFDVQEYLFPNEVRGTGVATEARSEVILRISEGGFPFFSDTLTSRASVSNVALNFKNSHIQSIDAVNESFIIKLLGVVRDYNWGEINFSESKIEGEDYDIPVFSFSAEGNLESFEPIDGCAEISNIKNINTPADILPSSKTCIAEGNYEKAMQLSFLARVYAFYDMKRVSDGSAHQAILMLEEQAYSSVSEEQVQSMMEVVTILQDETSEELAQLCKSIIDLGAPNYHPVYMIQHGMGAFSNSGGNGLVEGFNSELAWQEVLKEFNCVSSE